PDLASGKRPEAAEQRPRFAPNQQHPPVRFDEGERDGHGSELFPRGGKWNLLLLTCGPREASILERTSVACGTGRRAYRRAEFHDRLVECAGGVGRDEGGRELNDPAADDHARDILADSE